MTEIIKPHRCAATCLEVGCNKTIHYQSDDISRPLYCSTHRTETGRHSYTKSVLKPKQKVYTCHIHSSIRTREPRCPICNRDLTEVR